MFGSHSLKILQGVIECNDVGDSFSILTSNKNLLANVSKRLSISSSMLNIGAFSIINFHSKLGRWLHLLPKKLNIQLFATDS